MNLLFIGGKSRVVLGCALTFAFAVAAAGGTPGLGAAVRYHQEA
jgi:hypothetical protein